MGKRRRKDKMAKQRQNPSWENIVKENKMLQEYYKVQNIVSDDEWDEFLKFCRKDLPSTFRITEIRGHAKDLLRSLKEGYISKLATEDIKIPVEDAKVDSNTEGETEQDLFLEPLEWYPGELAWNNNLSRRFIRRSEVLKKLHRFLVEDSECGAITRQEAVSMIPPILLDVQSHHLVLDMCAAPGSKTAQIIEMMHVNCKKSDIPTGAVLANDADHKRCYMLTHQSKRLNTPCVIITNHDASIYPKMYSNFNGTRTPLEFDRVLCDVPCSGDGTIRKNPLLWHKWNPHLGNALHRLQMRILIRGLELLKVGGRLVYSTCSFNPIENEAVVSTVLKEANGNVQLVDCSKSIPLLKRRSGLKKWKVFDRRGKEIDESVITEGIKATMFPQSEDVLNSINIERCMRIYPHLQNTGGFFIAVLEKTGELPWQKVKRPGKILPWEDSGAMQQSKDKSSVETTKHTPDEVSDIKELTTTNSSPPSKKACLKDDLSKPSNPEDDSQPNKDSTTKIDTPLKIKRGSLKEDPYIFLDDSDNDLNAVRRFYGLSSEAIPSNLFLVRSTTALKKRHIYLVSESVEKIMTVNKQLKVINTGVKVVTRSPFRAGKEEHGVEFRLVQDGIQLLQNYISQRIVHITHQDVKSLISQHETKMGDLSQSTQSTLENCEMGCVVWHYDVTTIAEGEEKLSSDIWLCGHKGRVMVQVMLNKEERKHYLRILGVPIPEELRPEVKGSSWGDEIKTEESLGDKEEKEQAEKDGVVE